MRVTTPRRNVILVAGALIVAIGARNAGAQTADPARSVARDSAALVALEHEWLDAADAATLDRILADDFQHPVPTGDILTKSQHIAWKVAHPRPASLRARIASLDVRVYGDAAVATGTVAVSDSTGRDISRNLFTDVFIFRGHRWQAISAQETSVAAGPPTKTR